MGPTPNRDSRGELTQAQQSTSSYRVNMTVSIAALSRPALAPYVVSTGFATALTAANVRLNP